MLVRHCRGDGQVIKQLESVKKEMDELKAKTIPALNGTLKANGFNGQVKP